MKSVMRRLIVGYGSAVIFAYAAGSIFSAVYVRPPSGLEPLLARYYGSTIDTKDNAKIEARIIGIGDRGVLFFDVKGNRAILLPWDEIKQIDTAVAQ